MYVLRLKKYQTIGQSNSVFYRNEYALLDIKTISYAPIQFVIYYLIKTNAMKKNISIIVSACLLFLFASVTFAQGEKKAAASPPAKAMGKAGAATINISYSQPAVKGRKVWGDLVPMGQVWRTGANNATVFETDKDIKVEGQALKAGKYALFTIPNEKEWTIIFNKKSDQWGAYNYSDKDDALRVKVKSEAAKEMMERLTFDVKDNKVMFAWDKLMVGFKVE